MAWIWRYEGAGGADQGGPSESFTSQGDAESWLGQAWRDLAATGVVVAVLVEDGRVDSRVTIPAAAPALAVGGVDDAGPVGD